jgi:hypothetical protein
MRQNALRAERRARSFVASVWPSFDAEAMLPNEGFGGAGQQPNSQENEDMFR